MATDNEQTLRSFVGEWGKSLAAIEAAFRRYMAADCVWEQPSIPTTRSAEEAVALLHQFKKTVGLETFEAEIRQLAVKGDLGFVERVDHLRRADGSLIISAAVTGVFEFNRHGQIAAWREYFDSAPVTAVMAQAAQRAK
jgi:limonene-1,2-epoxide hydrolase